MEREKKKTISPYDEEMELIRRNNRYAYSAAIISAISFILSVISLIVG